VRRIWFTSDYHMGHRNIIGLCDRPFTVSVTLGGADGNECRLENVGVVSVTVGTSVWCGDKALWVTLSWGKGSRFGAGECKLECKLRTRRRVTNVGQAA
jgi:hypothetical protein